MPIPKQTKKPLYYRGFGQSKYSCYLFFQFIYLYLLSAFTLESWMFERFITVGYTALVDFTKVQPVADTFSSACEWSNIHNITEMILDHQGILEKALLNLRVQLNYHPVGYNLLPEKFTMPELQKLYETILDRILDRRNFQRKIVGTGILKRLNETKKGVAHKAPFYYKFDLRKYQKALSSGMGFEL